MNEHDPNTAIRTDPVVGEEPTWEENELVNWAQESVRKGPALVADALRQLVTLATAVLAGSTALLAQIPAPAWSKVLADFCLLGCLAACLWGLRPREALVNVHDVEEVRRVRDRGLRLRSWSLTAASWLLLAGLAALSLGTDLRWVFIHLEGGGP